LFLTDGIAGCGGAAKVAPEDYVVEELPAYLPSGEGEHLFLKVWKRGISTPDAARLLARHFGCPERELSWAGLKDAFAETTQWLSLPWRMAKNVETFSHEQVRVLEHKRHGNKLKNGHLEGNRFRLKLRAVKDVGAAQASFERLSREGLPNAFGQQRFGAKSDNAERGKQVLLGTLRVAKFERKLLLSAYQSSLFNRLLDERLRAGTFARALTGDVLKKHETGGEFVCGLRGRERRPAAGGRIRSERDRPDVRAFDAHRGRRRGRSRGPGAA
jgi:tRNA pseudouridine13 synthase